MRFKCKILFIHYIFFPRIIMDILILINKTLFCSVAYFIGHGPCPQHDFLCYVEFSGSWGKRKLAPSSRFMEERLKIIDSKVIYFSRKMLFLIHFPVCFAVRAICFHHLPPQPSPFKSPRLPGLRRNAWL